MRLNVLLTEMGNELLLVKALGKEFMDYLGSIFLASRAILLASMDHLIHDSISNREQDELLRLPNEIEIKRTLFTMSNLKAPKPNGMSILFFKYYWIRLGGNSGRWSWISSEIEIYTRASMQLMWSLSPKDHWVV
uniref:Uncharacterized protein n=1 Tax=Cannabis sativa TaxID=3483 RepID=A0A803NS32_CANSA